MKSKIVLNEYTKADVISDILSQSIEKARKEVTEENSEEAKTLLQKLLDYEKEVKKGNQEVINKILKGEI